MTQQSSWQETINNAVEYHQQNMHTALPAIVVRTINSLQGQSIDVQPSLNVKMFDDSPAVERPPILNVPVVFPASSTSAITFPLNPGDPVLLIFSERGLDSWKSGNGYPTTPTDYRMFDYQDCFAIPGPFPVGRAPNNPSKRRWAHSTNDLVVAHNLGSGVEVELRLSESGKLIINTDVAVEVNAPETTWTGDITHNGAFINTGMVVSNNVILDAHVHSGVQSGPSVSGPPVKG